MEKANVMFNRGPDGRLRIAGYEGDMSIMHEVLDLLDDAPSLVQDRMQAIRDARMWRHIALQLEGLMSSDAVNRAQRDHDDQMREILRPDAFTLLKESKNVPF